MNLSISPGVIRNELKIFYVTFLHSLVSTMGWWIISNDFILSTSTLFPIFRFIDIDQEEGKKKKKKRKILHNRIYLLSVNQNIVARQDYSVTTFLFLGCSSNLFISQFREKIMTKHMRDLGGVATGCGYFGWRSDWEHGMSLENPGLLKSIFFLRVFYAPIPRFLLHSIFSNFFM